MNPVAIDTSGVSGTIEWLTNHVFDEAGWRHEFAHEIELFTTSLSGERGSYYSQLASITVGSRSFLELIPSHFQHVYGFGTWFYGGWIDGAVFQVESVRRGEAKTYTDAFHEFSMLLDSQPIDQAGDGFWGFTDDQHEINLFVEIEQSKDRVYVRGRLLTDSEPAYQRSSRLLSTPPQNRTEQAGAGNPIPPRVD